MRELLRMARFGPRLGCAMTGCSLRFPRRWCKNEHMIEPRSWKPPTNSAHSASCLPFAIAGLSRQHLHHFPLEIEIESLVDGGLEVGSLGRHLTGLNVAEDGARGVEPIDFGSHLAAVLAQEAQQVL